MPRLVAVNHFDDFSWMMKTIFYKSRFLEFIGNSARVLYHIGLAALSAAIALSLPRALNFTAKKVLLYWSFLGNEKLIVVFLEIAVAAILVFFFNVLGRSWRDRRLSNMAKSAGLVLVKPARGLLARRRIRKMKERQAYAKDVMIIGSTGLRTFVDPKGDLHQVLQNCRNAKIMLLDPFGEGARVRAMSIQNPLVTPETFREQVGKSIEFLKGLSAVKKDVKLKLYQDVPLLKLAILDDHIWIQHYHAGLDVQQLPEYVFKHDQNIGSLYVPFYQFFMTRWNDLLVPEYDLESDELVYRDAAGNERRRERFAPRAFDAAPSVFPATFPKRGPLPAKKVAYPFRQPCRRSGYREEDLNPLW